MGMLLRFLTDRAKNTCLMRVPDFCVSSAHAAETKIGDAVHGATSHLGGGGVNLDGGRDSLKHVTVTHRCSVLIVGFLGLGLSGLLVDGDVLIQQPVAVLETATAELVVAPVCLLALVEGLGHLHVLEVVARIISILRDLLYVIVSLKIGTTSRLHFLSIVTLVTLSHFRD